MRRCERQLLRFYRPKVWFATLAASHLLNSGVLSENYCYHRWENINLFTAQQVEVRGSRYALRIAGVYLVLSYVMQLLHSAVCFPDGLKVAPSKVCSVLLQKSSSLKPVLGKTNARLNFGHKWVLSCMLN